MIQEIVIIFAVAMGTLLILLAAVGIVRFPDLYTRMHAASKSASLGIGLIIIAGIIYFWSVAVTIKSIAVLLFIFLTIPIASHMIGKVAYSRNIKMYEGTCIDEMQNSGTDNLKGKS